MPEIPAAFRTETDSLTRPPGEHALQPRQKRAQVVRACDSCRRQRIKCDNHIPCTNCHTRGSRCSNAALKSITLPEAYREIERLRHKVQELEGRLEEKRKNDAGTTRQVPLGALLNPSENVDMPTVAGSRYDDSNRFQEGIHIRAGQSGNETWYGASSLFCFIGHISRALTSALHRTCSSEEMLNPNPASLEPSRMDLEGDRYQRSSTAQPDPLDADYLSPMQEEYFLGLYWQSYHTAVLPILDEAEFRLLYRSLCSTHDNVRKPSALVDIVVAICMQLGISMHPNSGRRLMPDTNDGTVAGRQYYLRCQKLLAYELESPSLSTLQCQLLCAVYLCSATFHNMSDSICATAVRTAYMLGLHLEPPESMPLQERELRRRLWWALYIIDGKIGIKYGRPFLLHQSRGLPRLLDHGPEAAVLAGSDFAPLGNHLSWLTFHHEQSKLLLVARAAYTGFYGQEQGMPAMLAEAPARHAGSPRSWMKEMEDWAAAVPDALKTRRVNGRPFSTNTPDLDIEHFSPLWLQRQRLLLELMYHNLCVNLYRPFIQFNPAPTSDLAEQTAVKCALHAMTLTSILYQVLSSTSILTGWHEAFQWQWNAAMTMVGFVLARPQGETTVDVRRSIDMAVANFDNFGDSFAVAASAASVMRKLREKVDLVIYRGEEMQVYPAANKLPVVTSPAMVVSDVGTSISTGSDATTLVESSLGFGEMGDVSLQDVLSMAFNVDQYAEPYMLWDSMGGFGA